jgi:SAM-dependent methyltransferase
MSSFTTFSGDIPRNYDEGMGPVVFEPYAIELAERVPAQEGMEILEIASGTGRVTRHLAERLLAGSHLTATDLNPDMLKVAQSRVGNSDVKWQVANALELPLADDSFDCVACAFGVMFYPDKLQGQKEARRVLRDGGVYLFSVWAELEANPWCSILQKTMLRLFPVDTPGFLAVPFGYCNPDQIRSTLTEAGFGEIKIDRVEKKFEAPTAEQLARGITLGSPLVGAIKEKGVSDMEPIVAEVTKDLAAAMGDLPMRGPMAALIIEAR